jgi:hypothetical protein
MEKRRSNNYVKGAAICDEDFLRVYKHLPELS